MGRIVAVSIILCSVPACVTVIAHDEQIAANAATKFAQIAFVDRDGPKAHGLLSPSVAEQLPGDKLSEMIVKMHPKSFPTRVTAVEFEPMPGQKGMLIYLKGTGEGEDFHYRFVMEGDAPSGYRVSGLFRGSGPYPPSNRRPLNPNQQIPG